jgi:hypothetical protein
MSVDHSRTRGIVLGAVNYIEKLIDIFCHAIRITDDDSAVDSFGWSSWS